MTSVLQPQGWAIVSKWIGTHLRHKKERNGRQTSQSDGGVSDLDPEVFRSTWPGIAAQSITWSETHVGEPTYAIHRCNQNTTTKSTI